MPDETKRPDETIPGGRYIDENGFWTNAKGEYIDADGNVVEEPVKAETGRRRKAEA